VKALAGAERRKPHKTAVCIFQRSGRTAVTPVTANGKKPTSSDQLL